MCLSVCRQLERLLFRGNARQLTAARFMCGCGAIKNRMAQNKIEQKYLPVYIFSLLLHALECKSDFHCFRWCSTRRLPYGERANLKWLLRNNTNIPLRLSIISDSYSV